MIPQGFGRPRPQPKIRKQKCKIVTKKKGDRVEKSIEGDCTPAQLKALEGTKLED